MYSLQSVFATSKYVTENIHWSMAENHLITLSLFQRSSVLCFFFTFFFFGQNWNERTKNAWKLSHKKIETKKKVFYFVRFMWICWAPRYTIHTQRKQQESIEFHSSTNFHFLFIWFAWLQWHTLLGSLWRWIYFERTFVGLSNYLTFI